MRLEIIDEENVLDTFFGLWLIRKIQSLFIIKVNPSRFVSWNEFFKESDVYKPISSDYVNTLSMMRECLKNLECNVLPGKLVIKFNKNKFVPGLDRVRMTTFVRLVTFGTASIQGYSIIRDILADIAENINEYVDEFIMSGGLMYGNSIL